VVQIRGFYALTPTFASPELMHNVYDIFIVLPSG